MAGDVETAIADAKKALTEGGVESMNDAFNQLQTASHKLAEALYQQAPSRQRLSRTEIRHLLPVLRRQAAVVTITSSTPSTSTSTKTSKSIADFRLPIAD